MTPEQIALARRAVACKGFRWMPGMRAIGRRSMPTAWFRLEEWTASIHGEWADALPDLTDPATLGCLLALVREAHACPYLQVSVHISREHGYRFEANPHHRGAWVDSEEEALVAALEAAP